MSYECEICFKKIAPEEVYDFLLKFKHKATERRKEIAKGNMKNYNLYLQILIHKT